MVDPLTSIKLASNIVQSISFIGGLLEAESQVRKNDGLTIKNAEIKLIAQTIRNLCQGLQDVCEPAHDKPKTKYSDKTKTEGSDKTNTEEVDKAIKIEADLYDLCTQCLSVADILLGALKDLEHESVAIGWSWRSFRVAILSMMSEQKVEDILARLERYRRAIDTTLLALLV
jgi:hypothetical protein